MYLVSHIVDANYKNLILRLTIFFLVKNLPGERSKTGEELLLDLEEELVRPLVPHPVGVQQGDEHVGHGAFNVPEQVLVHGGVH